MSCQTQHIEGGGGRKTSFPGQLSKPIVSAAVLALSLEESLEVAQLLFNVAFKSRERKRKDCHRQLTSQTSVVMIVPNNSTAGIRRKGEKNL